jgi:hypothetical protein
MASSDYNPVFPSTTAADDKIRTFVSEFYWTSDDASKDDEWLEYFLPDAVAILGPDTFTGIDGAFSRSPLSRSYTPKHSSLSCACMQAR